MGTATNEKTKINDRILTKAVRDFITQPSPVRNYLIDFIRDHMNKGAKSIALCFRGNAVTLYYRCRQLLRIEASQKSIIGEFDFRYARFTSNYKTYYLEELDAIPAVDISNFSDEPGKNRRRHIRVDLKAVSVEELEKILKLYIQLINDFLNPDLREYAFDPKTSCRKPGNLEKDSQQQLYAAYFLHNDLLYYDLEYTEHNSKEKYLHGRYDLLGLRREGDGYTLLLTELKSTRSACTQKTSGIAAHRDDYIKYLNSEYIETRKIEACDAIKLLFDIFEKDAPKDLCVENIKSVKIKFVFSDKATNFGKTYDPNHPQIEKVEFDTKSGIEKPY